ncbi:MAG TPA: hypothetical protein LFV92_01680, partial [Rickettsia endosymbiont of Ceroptres masudai]|nr:hypothetical protein [Rickettsia endosymbiont of Ceroptres masudai]
EALKILTLFFFIFPLKFIAIYSNLFRKHSTPFFCPTFSVHYIILFLLDSRFRGNDIKSITGPCNNACSQ